MEFAVEYAIEQLEKVKGYYIHNVKWTVHENISIIEYINKQIEELKKEIELYEKET